MVFKTEQEEFWANEFGSEYIKRNQGANSLAANLNFFASALRATSGCSSCIEFGANIGMNLRAIRLLFPEMEQHAIEINQDAVSELRQFLPASNIFHQSLLDFKPEQQWDLVVIKGVLIHINPDELENVYQLLVDSAARYLLVAEYYNPSPVALPYRGHERKLFKRDFAGEILDKYSDFRLTDYGFVYRRDSNFPQDDITWFLLERRS